MTHLGSFESRTRDPLRDRQPLRLVDPSNPCRCGRRIASSEEAGILRRDSLPVARHPREEVREWIEPVAEQLDDVAAIGPLYRFDRFKAPEACGRTCGTATRTCSRPADAPVQGRVQPRPRPHAGALASRGAAGLPLSTVHARHWRRARTAGAVVSKRGLDEPSVALPLLAGLTPRWSSEGPIRPFIGRHRSLTYDYLRRWRDDEDEHVRRLVAEGIRPRLPWGPLLRDLIANPSPNIPLLDALVDDPSPYVRRSVAPSPTISTTSAGTMRTSLSTSRRAGSSAGTPPRGSCGTVFACWSNAATGARSLSSERTPTRMSNSST